LWGLDAPPESTGEPIIDREWWISIGFLVEAVGLEE
jgi:hypothetical protein